MNPLFSFFRLGNDVDDHTKIISSIEVGVYLKGTNLWILICAILIASVGLNVNSTAVIIGAMLISPLMGPLMGIGLGLGINDLNLAKNALRNFGISVLAGLGASCIYFLISPMGEAHSELLSRTSPAIWDVLIASFGGLAGIIATSSKNKANVIPGVAIATALMPPLCTAGFGLAHQDWHIFFGAGYLFIINSVFISLSTLLTVRFLRFPIHKFSDLKQQARAQKLIYVIVAATLVPSFFATYNIIQNNRFSENANQFIAKESPIGDNYLLNKNIDPAAKTISLIYGGKGLTDAQKKALQTKLKLYDISDAKLTITEGFSMRFMTSQTSEEQKLLQVMDEKLRKMELDHQILDSVNSFSTLQQTMLKEASTEHPTLKSLTISRLVTTSADSLSDTTFLVSYIFKNRISKKEKKQLNDWTTIKMNGRNFRMVADVK